MAMYDSFPLCWVTMVNMEDPAEPVIWSITCDTELQAHNVQYRAYRMGYMRNIKVRVEEPDYGGRIPVLEIAWDNLSPEWKGAL